MKGYTYAHVLKEKGFMEVPESSYEPHYDAKRFWVERYLELAIVRANCGWKSVKYVLMQHPTIGVEEYVILSADDGCPMEGRYINVTANSKGAILSEVAENL